MSDEVDGFRQQLDALAYGQGYTQGVLIEQSEAQLRQLDEIRRQQAYQLWADQQRREQEGYVQALYARAAQAIHEGLLGLRSLGRRIEAPDADVAALWLSLQAVQRATRALDPARVDPAQRRDLIELRDGIAAMREALERRGRDEGEVIERWLWVEHEGRGLMGEMNALVGFASAVARAHDPSWEPPKSTAEADTWIAKAQREVDGLDAERPEPPPECASSWSSS